MDEEYVRKSDVDRIIKMRVRNIRENMGPGKGLTNSIINLQALRKEIDDLYSVKVKFDKEPPIWRKQE